MFRIYCCQIKTPLTSDLFNVTHPAKIVLIICVATPASPIIAVFQSVGHNVHFFPQRSGSLCYDTCDLLNLGQLHLKPLVHVVILLEKGPGHKRKTAGNKRVDFHRLKNTMIAKLK